MKLKLVLSYIALALTLPVMAGVTVVDVPPDVTGLRIRAQEDIQFTEWVEAYIPREMQEGSTGAELRSHFRVFRENVQRLDAAGFEAMELVITKTDGVDSEGVGYIAWGITLFGANGPTPFPGRDDAISPQQESRACDDDNFCAREGAKKCEDLNYTYEEGSGSAMPPSSCSYRCVMGDGGTHSGTIFCMSTRTMKSAFLSVTTAGDYY